MPKTSSPFSLHDPEIQDPRTAEPQPPFESAKEQEMPGSDKDMTPRPDHGEETYKGFNRLEGRAALITGGDSGIGRAVALAFAREGAMVAISFLPNEEKDAREGADLLQKEGHKVLLLPGDIRSEQNCESIVKRTVEEFGKIDILVHNAAFQQEHDSIEEFSTEEFDRTYKTNVYAMFWLCRAALPLMKPGSTIINTASIQAFDPSPGLLAYASTKGAIVNFTKGLAKSAMKRGVRVNAVAPGPVWTPLIPATYDKEKLKNFGANTVFERPAQPVELAPLYVFLASNESRYVTGEVYGATGGKTPV